MFYIDATIKQAQAKPKSKRDADARFTKKCGKSYYGYKWHIGSDADTNIIHSVEFTPDNIHDSKVFDKLVTSNEEPVFADKGFAQRTVRNRITSKNDIFLKKGPDLPKLTA